MKKATKGDWAGFHPGTNCLWAHYLTDTLLMRKAFPATTARRERCGTSGKYTRCCLSL